MKSFIITLSRIEPSLATATSLKDQLNKFGMEAELFEGTYGNVADDMMKSEGRELHPWGIKGPTDKKPSADVNVKLPKLTKPGVKGCFYSHYRLWQKCLDMNESIIIWEDDIVLTREYIPVEFDEVLILALGNPKKSSKYTDYLNNPVGVPEASEYFQGSMSGACGYAITPTAAKKLTDMYSKTFLPADNAINKYTVTIQIHNYIMGRALIKKDGKRSLTNRVDQWV